MEGLRLGLGFPQLIVVIALVVLVLVLIAILESLLVVQLVAPT